MLPQVVEQALALDKWEHPTKEHVEVAMVILLLSLFNTMILVVTAFFLVSMMNVMQQLPIS